MNARAFVFTGVEKPFEAREFPLPEVERIRARWREVADASWEGQV